VSIQAVAWVLDHSEARGLSRLVLISLANHASREEAECWPAQRTIAREAGISPGAVPVQIRELVKLGELEILDPGGPRSSARYRLPKVPGQRSGDERSAQDVNAERSGAERSARSKGERSAQPRGEQNRHRTVSEPGDTPPTPLAEQWARRWCELTGTPPTRPVLRKFIGQVSEHITATGAEPTEELLEAAVLQGIETPAGWGFVKRGADKTAVARAEDWMRDG
jgi:hypothetical protein